MLILPVVSPIRQPIHIYIFCLVLLLGLFMPCLSKASIKQIDLYAVRIDMQDDGRMLITESLHIQNSGEVHGISRTLPRYWFDTGGKRHLANYRLIDIMRDNQPEDYSTIRKNDTLTWRIGKSKHLLSEGKHHYVIRYEVNDMRLRRNGQDELRWNVIGSGWPFIINKAIFQFHLPNEDKQDTGKNDTRVTVLRADISLAGERIPVSMEEDGTLVTQTPIAPYRNFYVHLVWPDNVLPNSPAFDMKASLFSALPILEPFWHGLLPELNTLYLWLPFMLLLVYTLIYRPWRYPIPNIHRPSVYNTPLPTEVTPGLASYLMHRNMTDHGFAGDILYLIERGLIHWDQGNNERGTDQSQALVLSSDEDINLTHLPSSAQQFWRMLRQQTDTNRLALTKTHQPALVAVRQEMDQYYRQRCQQDLFYPVHNITLWAVLTAFIPLLFCYSYLSTSSFVLVVLFSPISALLLFFILFMFLEHRLNKTRQAKHQYPLYVIIRQTLPIHMALTILIAFSFIGNLIIQMPAGILSVVLAPLYLLITYHIAQPRYTQDGENMLAQVRGLIKQMEDSGDIPPSSRLIPGDDARLLPYMLALNMRQPVADRLLNQLNDIGKPPSDSVPYTWQSLSGLSVIVTSSSVYSDVDSYDYSSHDIGGDSW
ncbi:DUF2207 domain-containing protein [Pectobacterium sp. B1J-3]|uniref:DUF2207 domain-containing protein n=1 Tax=Pectobacterium sp. B1J-3 TaxID=3385371 RepID=UPI00390647C9